MIDKSILQPGDIILCRPIKTSLWSSWFISWGQHVLDQAPSEENYCHVAMLAADTDYLYEAKFPKTRLWKIDWVHMDERYGVELWRVKNVTPEQIAKAIEFADGHTGEWYDLPLFLWGCFDFKRAEVCSTYVQHSYEAAGIEVSVEGPGKKLTTPDEIAANIEVIERII